VNEKLRRVRLSLKQTAPTTPRFALALGIAELGVAADFGNAAGGAQATRTPGGASLGRGWQGADLTACRKDNKNGFARLRTDTGSDDFGEIRPARPTCMPAPKSWEGRP